MTHTQTPPPQHSLSAPPLARGSAGGENAGLQGAAGPQNSILCASPWWGGTWPLLAVMVVWAAVAVCCWPVDTVQITPQGATQPYFTLAAPLGQGVTTGYIHSLQRTPVRDYYAIVHSRLWSWREYVQSHNAGLPYAAPAAGRFILRPPWMIIEGGRQSWRELLVRVGTARLGHNILLWEEGGCSRKAELFIHVPRQRLVFSVLRRPVWALPFSAAPVTKM